MADASSERWAPIPGYHGRYEVSDQGRVRSWTAWRGQPAPRILTPAPNPGGYLALTLCLDGARAQAMVHRLVMEAHVGPCPDGMQVRHLDGDQTNNRLDNLEYGTPTENQRDRRRHGTTGNQNSDKTHCKYGHELTSENTYVYAGGTKRACRACRCRRQRERNAA